MRFKKREAKRLSLDITPLIDVIFLLLIFFMVSTTFISSPGIKVNLPKASVKSKTIKPDSIEIVITEKNKLYLEGKTIEKEKFGATLAYLQKKSKRKNLIIRADGNVRHKDVVYIMDTAKQAGIQRLSIAVTPKDTQ